MLKHIRNVLRDKSGKYKKNVKMKHIVLYDASEIFKDLLIDGKCKLYFYIFINFLFKFKKIKKELI